MTTSTVQRLLDQASIFDAIHAFGEYLGRADVEGLLGLFVADGIMNMGGGAVHRGRAELRELFVDRCRLYPVQSLHFSGSRLTAYDGHTASISSAVYTLNESLEQQLGMHTWGRYEDEMALVDGCWLFVKRHLLVAAVRYFEISEGLPARFDPVRRGDLPAD